MRCYLLFAFFVVFCPLHAQTNLVPNPSFELYNWIPRSIGDAPDAIQNWTFASEGGSGDYYHEKSSGPDYTTIDNYFGSEKPHSGSAYAGFCVTPIYREFLAAPLISKLEKGKKYKFTMYVSKGDHNDVSYLKEISVMFLSRKWILSNDLEMALPPQIIFYQDTGFTFHNGWQELTAIYTAKGTEQWIYIGAHQWRCDTCISVPGTPRTQSPWIYGGTRQAHYYVDDVSIVEIKEEPSDTTQFVTGETYAFSNILFETNSALLKEESQPVLDPIVEYLKNHTDVKVEIAGHTDSVGTDSSNYALSVARADAVKKFLADRGIAASRISTRGFGETRPVQSNATENGRAKNRRVEFVFTKTEG